MENSEKQKIKLKLGFTLKRIILGNKAIAESNKKKGEKDHRLITSLRKLAAASSVEYAIIQKISSGKKNAEITTLAAVAEGLGMTMATFFSYFDEVSEIEIQKEKGRRKNEKKHKSNGKTKKNHSISKVK
jgi:transcriptional regulator with XRE-family HTH domain